MTQIQLQRPLAEIVDQLGLHVAATKVPRSGGRGANDEIYAPIEGADLFRSCKDGERTEHLVRLAGWAINRGMDVRGASTICLGWNKQNEPPLDDKKVVDT